MAEKFWILWCPTSPLPPRIKFWDEKKAEEAAVIMVRRHHEEFIVMESRAGYSDGKPKRLAYSAKPKKRKPEVRASLPTWATYDDWQHKGRQVRLGEKSRRRSMSSNEAIFHVSQTDVLNGGRVK